MSETKEVKDDASDRTTSSNNNDTTTSDHGSMLNGSGTGNGNDGSKPKDATPASSSVLLTMSCCGKDNGGMVTGGIIDDIIHRLHTNLTLAVTAATRTRRRRRQLGRYN